MAAAFDLATGDSAKRAERGAYVIYTYTLISRYSIISSPWPHRAIAQVKNGTSMVDFHTVNP